MISRMNEWLEFAVWGAKQGFIQTMSRVNNNWIWLLQKDDLIAGNILAAGPQPESATALWACLSRFAHHKDGSPVHPTSTAVNAGIFFEPGYETTAHAIARALFELATHPDVQVGWAVPFLHAESYICLVVSSACTLCCLLFAALQQAGVMSRPVLLHEQAHVHWIVPLFPGCLYRQRLLDLSFLFAAFLALWKSGWHEHRCSTLTWDLQRSMAETTSMKFLSFKETSISSAVFELSVCMCCVNIWHSDLICTQGTCCDTSALPSWESNLTWNPDQWHALVPFINKAAWHAMILVVEY